MMATIIKFGVIVLLAMQINDQLANVQYKCNALRMINLDAPQMALQGDTIQLSCSFSLSDGGGRGEPAEFVAPIALTSGQETNSSLRLRNSPSKTGLLQPTTYIGSDRNFTERKLKNRSELTGTAALDSKNSARTSSQLQIEGDLALETLYAIKWYKDDREFYRFVVKDRIRKQAFPMDGINIDLEKSDNQTVVIEAVTLKTSGTFRCEVSTDAPSFITKSIERKIFIYSLPTEGPVIESASKMRHKSILNLHLGDQLNLRCASSESKPSAQLDWIVNEEFNLTAISSKNNSLITTLFNVSPQRRFVRLPKLQIAKNQLFKHVEIFSEIKNADESLHSSVITPFHRHPSATSPPSASQQTQNFAFATYELDTNGKQIFARPLSNYPPEQQSLSSDVELSSSLLETTSEISTTNLNLTVDINFIHYLMGHAENSQRPQKLPQKSQSSAQVTGSGQRSLGTAFKTKKANSIPNTLRQRLQVPDQSSSVSKLSLRIRCVARVMHISMSDEIKIYVFNKTTGELSNRQQSIEAMRRENKIETSSSGGESAKKLLKISQLSLNQRAGITNWYLLYPFA